MQEVSQRYGVEVHPCANPREALRGAQIVVTAGPIEPTASRSVDADWLEPGMLGVALDYDCYWRPAALKAAHKFFTDDVPQMEHLREHGHFRDIPRMSGEIGEVVAGKRKGRERPQEIIVAMNIGISVEDVTVARRVYNLAVARDRGTSLPF